MTLKCFSTDDDDDQCQDEDNDSIISSTRVWDFFTSLFFLATRERPRNSIKIIFWRINVDWSNNTYGHERVSVCVWNHMMDFYWIILASERWLQKTRFVNLCRYSKNFYSINRYCLRIIKINRNWMIPCKHVCGVCLPLCKK